MCWSWCGAGLDTGHGHYTVSGPIMGQPRPAERGEGGGGCRALHSFLSKMNRVRCVGSVTLPPPFTLPVHVRYTGHGLIPPLRGGRARPGGGGVVRLEAGTTLGLMGRGDTAAGMLATVRGHWVELR